MKHGIIIACIIAQAAATLWLGVYYSKQLHSLQAEVRYTRAIVEKASLNQWIGKDIKPVPKKE